MKRSKRKTRNAATANPKLLVNYIDSGYSAQEWRDITEAMRKLDPDPKAASVFPRGDVLRTTEPPTQTNRGRP